MGERDGARRGHAPSAPTGGAREGKPWLLLAGLGALALIGALIAGLDTEVPVSVDTPRPETVPDVESPPPPTVVVPVGGPLANAGAAERTITLTDEPPGSAGPEVAVTVGPAPVEAVRKLRVETVRAAGRATGEGAEGAGGERLFLIGSAASAAPAEAEGGSDPKLLKAIAAVASDTPTEGLAAVELRSKQAALEGDDSRPVAAPEGRDRAAVQRVVRRHMSAVRACYERELKKQPSLAGKIVVEFVIGPTGGVESARIATSTMGNATVETCLRERIARWRFPASKGGGSTTVRFPFTFRAQ